jgi:hypothetical protein
VRLDYFSVNSVVLFHLVMAICVSFSLGAVNVSVAVPVLIIDHCVSLDFSMVQQNSPICVRPFF